MTDLVIQIRKIQKKIQKSPGCDYLFEHFNELVNMLDSKKEDISLEENAELKGLIQDYARDSRFNNHSSSNWVRYSARCFYCADYLVRYLPESSHYGMESFLNIYFQELIQSGIAPILSTDVLNKYMQLNVQSKEAFNLYDILIRKAINGSQRFRLWSAEEVALAYNYTKSADRLIREYSERFPNDPHLKDWLPLLNTTRLANIWYEYPDSANYRHSGKYSRESISDSLDKMLDIHLELLSLWYWRNPQEVIETLPMEDMIEALEVSEDDEFEKVLKHIVTLPFNEKIKGILKHFTHDDEAWIVRLSQGLLTKYTETD